MKLDYLPECEDFKRNHPDEWKSFGCGPGGAGDFIVPDTMWGLSVRPACRGHDFEYRFCHDRSRSARKSADKRLLKNCLIIVNEKSVRWQYKKMRKIRCHTYYYMVRWFGGGSWKLENSPELKLFNLGI